MAFNQACDSWILGLRARAFRGERLWVVFTLASSLKMLLVSGRSSGLPEFFPLLWGKSSVLSGRKGGGVRWEWGLSRGEGQSQGSRAFQFHCVPDPGMVNRGLNRRPFSQVILACTRDPRAHDP